MTWLCVVPLILFLFFGCNWNPGEEPIITVGSQQISREKLEEDIDFMTSGVEIPEHQQNQIRNELVDQLIDHYLILEYGKTQGITISESEVQSALKELQKDYSKAQFHEALLRGYVDFEEWENRMREQFLVRKILESVLSTVPPPTYKEIKHFYETHRRQYQQPRMLRFQQIVTYSEDTAQALLEELKTGGDMADLAKEHSVAPEAENGGRVDWVTKGQLEEKMEKVLFSLPEGKTSPVVETPYGYHIFRVLDIRPAGERELTEVVREIEAVLLQEKRRMFCAEWLKTLRTRFSVTVDREMVNQL